jgi:hypothetical protein
MDLDHENQEATKQGEADRWRRRPVEGLVDWLNRITPETAAIMNDGRTSKELMDELYDDETGLPK